MIQEAQRLAQRLTHGGHPGDISEEQAGDGVL